MIDLLLSIGVSNVCLSLALAIVAWVVQTRSRRPLLAHLLWVLVLVELVTPPIVTLPLVAFPGAAVPAEEDSPIPLGPADAIAAPGAIDPVDTAGGTDRAAAALSLETAKLGLVLLWTLGSAGILLWSLLRIHRFDRLLGMASRKAPPALQEVATELGRRLGLEAIPGVYTTTAQLSPMVWWIGGRVRIYLPDALPGELRDRELRWILAHELAHVRRRDHLVRWLEWLARVCFWWNPVAWWARRSLRAAEETCCDALVLSVLRPNPHTYASSLLNAIELLASPVLRPPAMASEIDSGGFLERRLEMIISKRPMLTTPRWLQAGVLTLAAGLLPLGVVHAQAPDYEAVGARLAEAVQAGELTAPQAAAMIGALARERFVEQLEAARRRPRAMDTPERTTREEARRALERLRRVADRAERDERRDDGIQGHYARMGVSAEDFGSITRILHERGVERERIEPVLGAMLRVVHGLRAEGERFELDPDLAGHLERLGLSGEQIELVVGLSRRILLGLERAGRGDRERARDDRGAGIDDRLRDFRRVEEEIRGAVEAGRLSEEEAEARLVGLRMRRFPERDEPPRDRPRDEERTLTLEEYRRVEAELRQLVEDGRVKEEDAERRLVEMRRRIVDDREAPESRRRRR